MDAATHVVDVGTLLTDINVRPVIRQMKKLPRGPYRDAVRRMEVKKPDARLVLAGNVGPYVQFGKGGYLFQAKLGSGTTELIGRIIFAPIHQ